MYENESKLNSTGADIRVPTVLENLGKISCHGEVMELQKFKKGHGEVMEFQKDKKKWARRTAVRDVWRPLQFEIDFVVQVLKKGSQESYVNGHGKSWNLI